jgi:hypothetical protein
MKKMYFILMVIAIITAPAVKGQVNMVKPENIPDSLWSLNDCYFKIEKLGQYQKEKRKLESSIRNGDVLLVVHIIPRSFFKEDSGKSIIAGFINEQWKTDDWKVDYIVRFDSAHHVLSVKKSRGMTHEETELALAPPKK